jgi:DNA-binding NtrC family response regulator
MSQKSGEKSVDKSGDARLQVLVVDDDDLVIAGIRMTLPSHWRLHPHSSQHDLPQASFTAALVDMHLSKNTERAEGLAVIASLHQADPHLEIIAMSGDLDRSLMEGCLKAGASRFLAKPLSPDELLLTLEKIEALQLLRVASSRGQAATTSIPWIGESAVSSNVKRAIANLSGERGPILIEGESGTGKEVASGLIHAQELVRDSGRPFVTVNVAALPETVFESEFFGHVRGAFTGADQNKMGLAEAAHGGDLFLDEIEALPLTQQAKLLRFLESGEIRRVGAKESLRVNVRVIAATNRNLETMVAEGKFREDLLWRLNGRKLVLPPLRDRMEDLGALANHFLQRDRPRRNKTLADDAIQTLAVHHWPGNVRELKRVVEQISLYSPLPLIRAEDVLRFLPVSTRTTQTLGDIDLSRGITKILGDFEADIIRQALAKKNDVDEAAALLGISRSSLYKKIKDYNIESRG